MKHDAAFMRTLMENVDRRATPEYKEGYDAGLEYIQTGTVPPMNPYDEEYDPARAAEWNRGFEQAEMDS